MSSELAELKRCATPRPDWRRCGHYIEGGPERWEDLYEGRSSDRILNLLLAQMAGIDESEVAKGDPFTGQVIYLCVIHNKNADSVFSLDFMREALKFS